MKVIQEDRQPGTDPINKKKKMVSFLLECEKMLKPEGLR